MVLLPQFSHLVVLPVTHSPEPKYKLEETSFPELLPPLGFKGLRWQPTPFLLFLFFFFLLSHFNSYSNMSSFVGLLYPLFRDFVSCRKIN